MPSSHQTGDPSEQFAPDLQELMAKLQHTPGSVSDLTPIEERPLYGFTLFLARCTVETRFGSFRAFIFQDVIHKGYLIALTFGNVIDADELAIRIHSSCVTSETLRGCDCDCLQQLEGALATIAAKGCGILFYLMQEGRGVGYLAKARDRMLVQASLDRLSTFQAYVCMGLREDHRSYENVSHICHLLGLKAGFIVLTNNPDKVDALRQQGLNVIGTQSLEFEPSPYNLAYLSSKAASGHSLSHPTGSPFKSALPPEPVVPFKPHVLPHAQRFIYSASYLLPMRPVADEVILSADRFRDLQRAGLPAAITGREDLRGGRTLIRTDREALAAFRRENPSSPISDILSTPYWFRAHVHYDIVTSQEYVVLTYGQPTSGDRPVVRLQSESLFNRFPLKPTASGSRFERAVRHIVHYGTGAIILLYYDGRGAGFGAYAADRMMTEHGLSTSVDESYRKLGIGYDSRDFEASMVLLKHHLPCERIQMVMNSPSSLVRKKEYAAALNANRIDVENWIFLGEGPGSEDPDHSE